MILNEQLYKLANDNSKVCVTVSLNTHRTHPENIQDEIVLKNLLKEAETRVVNEFGKRPVSSLLEKINSAASTVDVNYNLNSLHIFLSNDTFEIVKSIWPVNSNSVQISEKFSLRPLIKAYALSMNYLIMVLSQSGVQLFEAINDTIVGEIRNEDFPFSASGYYTTHKDKASDPKHMDDLVREFLNIVDKALVKVHQATGLGCVVICSGDNYSRLQQVADKPGAYLGHSAIDYNKVSQHQIVQQAWEYIQQIQNQQKAAAIAEMKEAVSQGKVVTDFHDIFHAAIDGRGEILIIHQDFSQPVLMKDDRSFDLVEDVTKPDVIDDIASIISWEVISKKGKVVFTTQEEIKELGEIVLKTRY